MSIITMLSAPKAFKSAKSDETHPNAKAAGIALAAIAVIGGIFAIYGLSAAGFLGHGPFAHMSLGGKIALLASVGSIDAITVLGLCLRKCGFGKESQQQQHQHQQ